MRYFTSSSLLGVEKEPFLASSWSGFENLGWVGSEYEDYPWIAVRKGQRRMIALFPPE